MSKRKKNIEEFFSKYESNFNNALNGDQEEVLESMQASFTSCFMESNPKGVICAQNNKEFIDKMKQVYQFYRTIGSKGMAITSKEINLLDEFHASAKVYWRYSYEKDGHEGSIDFHNLYFITTADGDPKIFAFIVGDEMKVLKEHGLVQQEAEVP